MFLYPIIFISFLQYSICSPTSLGLNWYDYYVIPETDYQARSFNTLLFSIKSDIDSLEFVDPLDKEGKYRLDYAPSVTNQTHPETQQIVFRPGYSEIERLWLRYRDEKAYEGFKSFIVSSGLELNFDILDIDPHDMPRTAITLSGGGNRAMLCGGGLMKAVDRRSTKSSLKGLLDAAHILSGLSGGSWTVASVALHDFQSIDDLNDKVWKFDSNFMLSDPKSPDRFSAYGLWRAIAKNFFAKAAITQVCITDIWGELITNFVITDDITFKFSTLIDKSWFKTNDYPFPLIVSTLPIADLADTTVIQPIIETTPFDFRSDWKYINGSYPLMYIGSNFTEQETKLVKGFDNAGFCIGSSANIFNLLAAQFENSFLKGLLKYMINNNSQQNVYTAAWPNPFKQISSFPLLHESEYLHLSDGGSSGQNIPITPLLHFDRKIDFIVAADSSNDDDGYPTGISFHKFKEMQQAFGLDYSIKKLPEIPSEEEMVRRGLNKRNVIFGVEKSDGIDTPVILYIPNRHMNYDSNKPTTQVVYSHDDRKRMIENMYSASTLDEEMGSDWSKCVSCAMIERWRQRNNVPQLKICTECFNKFSWNKCQSHFASDTSNSEKSLDDCDWDEELTR